MSLSRSSKPAAGKPTAPNAHRNLRRAHAELTEEIRKLRARIEALELAGRAATEERGILGGLFDEEE